VKIIALDIGTKRIGTAYSDENQKIAFPGKVFSTTERDLLLSYIKLQKTNKIIIGKTPNQEEKLNLLIGVYKSLLEGMGYNVLYQDESMTSHESRLREFTKSDLNNSRQTKKDVRKEIDHIAAMHILQRYLDSK